MCDQLVLNELQVVLRDARDVPSLLNDVFKWTRSGEYGDGTTCAYQRDESPPTTWYVRFGDCCNTRGDFADTRTPLRASIQTLACVLECNEVLTDEPEDPILDARHVTVLKTCAQAQTFIMQMDKC